MMNKKSGVLGVSGVSSDNRDVSAAAEAGNERAKLALDIQVYEIKKYVGAFAAAMGGVDAVLFTGGIGENDKNVRLGVCSGMEYMGIKIDAELNDKFSGQEHEISTADSKVKVWIVPTNEELMIARDTLAIVAGK
jgi:acetate kinase